MLPTDRIRNKAIVLHDARQGIADGEYMPFDQSADVCVVQIDGGDVVAVGTLTLALNVDDGETVTIGNHVYTYKDALTGAVDEVLKGVSASLSLDALIAAINKAAAVVPALYDPATKENVWVTAAAGAGDTMVVTCRWAGTSGNAIQTLEALLGAGNVWGAATLASGTDFVGTVDFLASLNDLEFEAIAAFPIDGGSKVTSATAPGAWRIDMSGVAIFKAPVSAYTSGSITVRILHRRKSQG
jgi:hypothetical protein